MVKLKELLLESIDQIQRQNYPWMNHKILETSLNKVEKLSESELTDRTSPFHLSASAFVLKGDRAFFIQHPYLNRLLLPAGHVEAGEFPVETAKREFYEETGFSIASGTQERLIDLRLFDIPANPIKGEGSHLHLDLRYYFSCLEKKQSPAELKWYLLEKEQAPEEFQVYYALNNE